MSLYPFIVLFQPGARVLPARARIFVQGLHNKWLSHFRYFDEKISASGHSLSIPSHWRDCEGLQTAQDMQIDELLKDKDYELLFEEPVCVAE